MAGVCPSLLQGDEHSGSLAGAHYHKIEENLQRFAQICVSTLKAKTDVSIQEREREWEEEKEMFSHHS